MKTLRDSPKTVSQKGPFILATDGEVLQAEDLNGGMFAVQCENVKLAADALEIIKAMVMQGTYDAQLTKISQGIRRRFKTTDLAHNRML